MALVVPAILPSSQEEFDKDIVLISNIEAVSRIQIDVVDGRFASPASWPYTAPRELAALVKAGTMLPHLDRIHYEIDLMCFDALDALEHWLALGASHFVFHAESTKDLSQLLVSAHKQYGEGLATGLATFGVALNIASDLALLEPCIEHIRYVQFMGIARIGRQGQPFDQRVYEKVRIFHSRHPGVRVQIDGGVSLANAKELIAAGATRLVVGSVILRAGNPMRAIADFEALKTPYAA